ncbi:MAG TPA: tripartite tricarboxylate transporter substrate-binding protein, partial [Beijerinckiaceae bacterium]|nr:tripartite tricarboxylate transporter substrate-binding protein [Beijerinckiaceae bacterium]
MRSYLSRFWIASALIVAWSVGPQHAGAQSVGDFYRGKQITFIVGSDPGGGYDTLARLVARHLGQFIPGNPSFVVENQPGAGSMLMSNRIYNIAPQDGTVIGLVQRGVMIANLTQQKGAQFAVDKFNWIGNVSTEPEVVVSWHTSPIRTIEDALQHEMVVGGTGPTSDTEASARIMNETMHTKLKIVTGYPGTADLLLAMQRGEIEGFAWSWSELKGRHPDLLANHMVNILVQAVIKPDPELPGVPRALDYVKDPTDREVATLFYTMKSVARPILAGPHVPPERVALLRHAFDEMSRDPDFL